MKKKYLVKHRETSFNYIEVDDASSDEEAIKKASEIAYSDKYEGCDKFEEEEFIVVSSKIIDGTELKQEYIERIDATVIIEYTYKDENLIGEQIIGYYHGEPYKDGIKEYAYKGVYINHEIFE